MGRLKVILCKGRSPLHPRGLNPCGTCSTCPGGEDHLKRRSSSPPVPPLLGCRLCSPVPRPNRRASRRVPLTPAEPATLGASPPSGTCSAGTISAAGGLMPGCRGRSPRQNKLKNAPFPPGRGVGGWGKEIKLKAGLAGDKEGKPPIAFSTVAGIASAAWV